jgi:hypothetical protein
MQLTVKPEIMTLKPNLLAPANSRLAFRFRRPRKGRCG